MSHDFTIFIVDDAQSARRILESAFSKDYRTESFATAEDCLVRLRLDGPSPDLLLLDVDLPGLNGYALCRKIKERQDLKDIPAIFISSLDDAESRLEGYDAGGMDYVVKPYSLAELKLKVGAAHRRSVERAALKDKMAESALLSSRVLSNLDQYAALITFLRSLNECASPPGLLKPLFALMQSYGLQATIQLRLPDLEMTVNEYGESIPLEVAVINNLRSMDRIFEFKSRAAYNFEHLTLLINNVPLHDPQLCDQLRDLLAIAAESANSSLQAMQIKSESTQARAIAADLLSALQAAEQDFEKDYAMARDLGSSSTLALLGELAKAFASLGMSDEQENNIENIVHANASDLAEIYDFSAKTKGALDAIAKRLAGIAERTSDQGPVVQR